MERIGEIIIFPRVGTYTIDWGDGTFPEEVTNTASHTTNNARTPTIRASNTIAAFSTGSDTTTAAKLSPIKQGGTVRRTTMKSAFRNAVKQKIRLTFSGIIDIK